MTQATFRAATVLETARLLLRPHRHDDFVPYAEMFQDKTFIRYTTGTPLSREDAWTKMIRHGGHWSCLGFGYWAIEEKATRRFIGELGFADFKRLISPSLEGKLEAGWGLATACHGKGYADEALKATLLWAGTHFPDREIVCMMAPENTASLRLAQRNGFTSWTETRYKEFDSILLRRI